MALIDEVVIRAIAGNGGNGCVAFRREKYVPYGGPNGGNGGRGGSVILVATRDKTSLLDFKYQPKYEGERGEHGMGSQCDGHSGKDLILKVPLGTLVYDLETGALLVDLKRHEQSYKCASGGRGGRGNQSFATSTNRAPRVASPGRIGDTRELKLELRLLADLGLVGLPNAGKSTLLRTITAARPKAAAYPFTTLEPHLGVVEHKDQTVVIADLPGLIEGASEGAGLGHKFLRHVARNRALLHLVDGSEPMETIQSSVAVIRKELHDYDAALGERPEILVFTKMDLLDEEEQADKRAELDAAGLTGFYISSGTSQGIPALLDHLAALAPAWREQDLAEQEPDTADEQALSTEDDLDVDADTDDDDGTMEDILMPPTRGTNPLHAPRT
jgi:GTP-binding protein